MNNWQIPETKFGSKPPCQKTLWTSIGFLTYSRFTVLRSLAFNRWLAVNQQYLAKVFLGIYGYVYGGAILTIGGFMGIFGYFYG
jgi:hypothetical protein